MTTQTTTKLEPGVYRTKEPLTALDGYADKRVKHDWRAAPIPEGTLFEVHLEMSPFNEDDKTGRIVIWRLGDYCHQTVNLHRALALAAVLVRVPDADLTATQHLQFMNRGNWASPLLDALLQQGRITLADIDALVFDLNAGL